MTIEEAIEQLKLNKPSAYSELRNSIDMAIDALENQIPKKPYDVDEREENDFYYLGFMCPSCNKAIVGQPYRPNYCKHCGQALNWLEVENDSRRRLQMQ